MGVCGNERGMGLPQAQPSGQVIEPSTVPDLDRPAPCLSLSLHLMGIQVHDIAHCQSPGRLAHQSQIQRKSPEKDRREKNYTKPKMVQISLFLLGMTQHGNCLQCRVPGDL